MRLVCVYSPACWVINYQSNCSAREIGSCFRLSHPSAYRKWTRVMRGSGRMGAPSPNTHKLSLSLSLSHTFTTHTFSQNTHTHTISQHTHTHNLFLSLTHTYTHTHRLKLCTWWIILFQNINTFNNNSSNFSISLKHQWIQITRFQSHRSGSQKRNPFKYIWQKIFVIFAFSIFYIFSVCFAVTCPHPPLGLDHQPPRRFLSPVKSLLHIS